MHCKKNSPYQHIVNNYIVILQYINTKMGTAKTEAFTDRQNELANLFKVLGNPGRLAILEFLVKQTSCVCGEIVNEIGLAQPTISLHLKELKNVGLVQGTISGKNVCYCINREKIGLLQDALKALQPADPSSTCCS